SPPDGANERQIAIEKITKLESISANRVAQILPLLPPITETEGLAPRSVISLKTPVKSDKPGVDYWALLPVEYHADHSYPVVIALHGGGQTPPQELDFWGGAVEGDGQSQRYGYIVLAPKYAADQQRTYDYGAGAHHAVLETLNDARRRFNIDSDRVFLSGHQMGGDA